MPDRPCGSFFLRAIAAVAVGLLAACDTLRSHDEPPDNILAYEVTEGRNLNYFFRESDVAAHVLLRDGRDPRLIVAFPAGNSGVGVWFDRAEGDVVWRVDHPPRRAVVKDAHDRPLYGVRFRATAKASRLSMREAVLSNVRFLRDYQSINRIPPEIAVAPMVDGRTIHIRRDRLDGAPGYALMMKVVKGDVADGVIIAADDGEIGLDILAASGDAPLTPLAGDDLLNASAVDDPAARNALTFLSYREKFLAGSWRFNTYFGRDTLMSARLLMPALQPAAIEAAIGSVLARLSPGGEVAHEEGVSEFAIVERLRSHQPVSDAPILDYGMIDDDFMLAPVIAPYLLDHPQGRTRAAAFLSEPVVSLSGDRAAAKVGDLLVENLRFVLAQAAPFAADPKAASLVAIKPGRATGQWRDSEEGLGGGRYAYDVNAALIPAALAGIARLFDAGLLDPYLAPDDRAAFAAAGGAASVWREKAPPLFKVSISPAAAKAEVSAYARALGVDDAAALASVGDRPVVFHALALDAQGKPVRVINSDEGAALLFGDPPVSDLDVYVAAIMRPFPAGLLTDVGLLVANPAYADDEMQSHFTRNHYHGAVVWSWQQATLAAGLARQLERSDLSEDARARLEAAQSALWTAIKASRAVQTSELWSWTYANGRFSVAPFGADGADVDESNAAQLWSTVYLAVRPPE
ncbi:MAG: hypothetical protein A3E78_15085 [Alphaproteobacteria bacterium RIFCSPHIGHO2_12_FULL_63_12]|nr:MAG: hypothetical protein A3E78_15085 [Alphaproteobacteria bacterium RIFCSPHIGHO2_12_FULL_63_12]